MVFAMSENVANIALYIRHKFGDRKNTVGQHAVPGYIF